MLDDLLRLSSLDVVKTRSIVTTARNNIVPFLEQARGHYGAYQTNAIESGNGRGEKISPKLYGVQVEGTIFRGLTSSSSKRVAGARDWWELCIWLWLSPIWLGYSATSRASGNTSTIADYRHGGWEYEKVWIEPMQA